MTWLKDCPICGLNDSCDSRDDENHEEPCPYGEYEKE